MTIEEARDYWQRRLERTADYSDEHWDAEERHAHRDYIDAMRYAITALTVCIEYKNPKTNGDKIRQMTDEGIAEFLRQICDCCSDYYKRCESCPLFQGFGSCKVIEWLKQEVVE